MANALKKATQSTVVDIKTANSKRIDDLLRDAGKGAFTMVEKTRAAVLLAVSELPTKGKVKERVDAVVKLHAKTFAGIDKNVKALFVNLLTLAAAPKNTMVETKPAAGKQGAVVMKAQEAVQTISKNRAAAAATMIRQAEGTGRAEKPKAEPKAEISAEAQFYADLKAKLADKDAVKRVLAILAEAGYEVSKKAVSKKAASKPAKKAAVTPKPLASITEGLSEDLVIPPVLTHEETAKLTGGIPAAD
jgi:hypothetical protein